MEPRFVFFALATKFLNSTFWLIFWLKLDCIEKTLERVIRMIKNMVVELIKMWKFYLKKYFIIIIIRN